VAYSHESSHSGYHALRAAVAPLARAGRFFGAALRTGAHEASLDALREGYADVAAIDAVTYALLSDRRPAAVAHVRVLGWTPAAPGLPYVTRVETPPERLVRLRRALVAASRDPAAGVALGALRIDGMVPTETAMYARIVDLDEDARRLGYVSLG
jgi:ABC-type phosphate/phosphonate transport system substrate-binding protein